MKKYKAIFIDGKKLFKSLTAGIFAIGILSIVSFSAISNHSLASKYDLTPEDIVADVFPAAGAANNAYKEKTDDLKSFINDVVTAFFGFNTANPSHIISSEIPISTMVTKTGIAKLAKEKLAEASLYSEYTAPNMDTVPNDIPLENQAPIKAVNLAANKDGDKRVVLGNETSYSINIDETLETPPSIDMSTDGPKVLIVHTHGTESYTPEGSTVYDMTGSDRSMDTENNVVKCGAVICEILNKKGIETIHDKTLHDHPSYNGSYASSLEAIENYLKKYPSIQVVLDIHRDSIVYSDNTKAKAVTNINGKPAAQLMFVVGTDEKGLEHPNWRENIKTAIHLQNAINQRYPTLMRHVNLRQERFNGHTTNGSMIIETGSSGNTLNEALYGLSLAADCIGDYLNSLK